MTRRGSSRWLACSLLALAVLGCKRAEVRGPSSAGGAALRLEFSPPADRWITERSITTRTEAFTSPDRRATPWVESVEATLRSRFHRAADVWELTQEVPSVTVKRNGEAVQSKLVDLVTRFPLKVQLGLEGAFVKHLNPEDAEAAVRAVFTEPREAEAILEYFRPEALAEQARREWEGKYGGLFARDLSPGQTFYGVETVGLSSGEQLAYGVERRVVGWTSSEHGQALALRISCLGAPQGEAKAALERLMAERQVDALEPSVVCEGEQLVAANPFVPVRTTMRLVAHPKARDGRQPVEVALEKSTAVVKLE